jgi:hypothetical protein
MVVTRSPQCKVRRGVVSFVAGLSKTQALKDFFPMCIAMMHEAEEEEEQER